MARGFRVLAMCATLSCTAANPDEVGRTGACTSGTRGCIGGRPIACFQSDGGTSLASETCPGGAACDHGRCVAPAGAALCGTDADCQGGRVCTAMVDVTAGDALATFCVPPEGITAGAEPCGYDRECRSNLCLATRGESSRRVCFRACRQDVECPVGAACQGLSATVTGVDGTIRGCAPM